MFVDFQNQFPHPGPWEPKPRKVRITKRQEKIVIWLIFFNLLMLLLAPVAGFTIFDAVIALLRR
ncbi:MULTISPECIES: hypothetical protein [Lichenihabitans]|uniref:hypothetical protein n=1 Tax=Lichenihabitans TaxID=2723776 RepID=UPI001035E69A|nr:MULTISPECIES: hypothetical protein [Lichenihabitans]UDL94047.1 hypothetical protein LGH83_16060 [Lichenihabitans sp. PAMC28606]